MIELWNQNMTECFSPGWIVCLDESMSIWHNRWTCPGWVYCPRKPHPFGNEYHDIACGLSKILFRILMVEGKDQPQEVQREFKNEGSTTEILLECCKPIFHSGRVVILDSGFCVLDAILKLRSRGVYASAVIKKRRYWPKHIKGDEIERHMKDKNIGDIDVINGNINDIAYKVFCLKDAGYVMKLKSTYGTDLVNENDELNKRVQDGNSITFKYTETFSNHYKFRHAVDDHNKLRHALPSIENTWYTHRWSSRVFSFLLAISEVNAFQAFKYFIWSKFNIPKLTLLKFRRKLAMQLIENTIRKGELEQINNVSNNRRNKKRKPCHSTHYLLTAPNHASFFSNDTWVCTSKTKYPQYKCKTPGCQTRVRSYCSCHVGYWLCRPCHSKHFATCLLTESFEYTCSGG